MIQFAELASDSQNLFDDNGPASNMAGLVLESNPEKYIEKIAKKQPAFHLVFQAMSLRFRYEAHCLQKSLQRFEKSGAPINTSSNGGNSRDIKQIKQLIEQQRNQLEIQINSLKQELSSATQEITQLKAIGLENQLKLEALEGKQKVEEEQEQAQ